MSSESLAIHYVCTRQEARKLIESRDAYWICNCVCREKKGGCGRSRMDLCLWFNEMPSDHSGKRKASWGEVEEILREAEKCHLVVRPFRNEARTATDGICFCCSDCCSFFLEPASRCDKGALQELTRIESCSKCGACKDVCHFGARTFVGGELTIKSEKCFGCGLCVDVCPENCIAMIERNGEVSGG